MGLCMTIQPNKIITGRHEIMTEIIAVLNQMTYANLFSLLTIWELFWFFFLSNIALIKGTYFSKGRIRFLFTKLEVLILTDYLETYIKRLYCYIRFWYKIKSISIRILFMFYWFSINIHRFSKLSSLICMYSCSQWKVIVSSLSTFLMLFSVSTLSYSYLYKS